MAAGAVAAGAAHGAGSIIEEPLARVSADDGIQARSVSPLTVLDPEDWLTQGYTTLPQILANLVPSFVHPEPALADFTDHARPSALRGLAPDHMVVLLDGKRRSPAAWLHRGDTYGRGSVGVDLSVIPLAAVERIEILRDGASARYGSGAVAGVINVVLKDDRQGGSVRATYGQHRTHFKGVPQLDSVGVDENGDFFLVERADLNTDDGDGDTVTVSAQGGFTLFDDGFIDITAEFREQDPTNRSGADPRNIYPLLPSGEFDPRELFVDRRTHRYGNPEQEDVKLLTNFGMSVGESSEFYGHVGYTARNAESADEFVLAGSDANVLSIHPDGYLPLLASDDENRYFTLGFKGVSWGWNWDFSYTQDEHEMDISVSDSLNPSLGDISPTAFSLGNFEGRHLIVGLDLTRDFQVGLAGPLAVAWGVEYRSSEYENESGGRASWVAQGARTDEGALRPPGSQGYFGVRPVDDFDDSLLDLGAYVQLQAPVTERVDVLAGVRFDDEEANSDVSARLGARWRVSDRLSLRSTVSRNFRNPTAAQAYFQDTQLVPAGSTYLARGTYFPEHPVAQALGAGALDSETSLNVSGGLQLELSESASVSFDVYRIEIDDRIVLSSFMAGPVVDAALSDAGITGVAAARYFFNGVDTRTQGADLAGRYRWESPVGPIELEAGLNVNDTKVTGTAGSPAVLAGLPGETPRFDAREQAQIETWTPESKLHLSARWESERLTLESRLSRYGEVEDVGSVPARDQELGTPWLLDFHARYRLTKQGYAAVGVHNFLDEYIEARPREASDPVENRVRPYSNYAPFGFNGRFVYLRVGMDFGR